MTSDAERPPELSANFLTAAVARDGLCRAVIRFVGMLRIAGLPLGSQMSTAPPAP